MATAAPSPLASSLEKTNGAKLSRLLIDGGTTVLRKVFDRYNPPANLAADLNAKYSILNNLLRRRILNGHQWDRLFPPGGAAPDSNTFDITLLFILLTNICGLSPPPSGWHTKPPPSDTSYEANLARVKFYRNVLYGHVTTTGVDTPTFSGLWTEISGVLVDLGLDQAEVDKLKAEKGGEQDYLDALLEWADSEDDIKSQLKNIQQFQTKTHQAVEEVCQTQTKIVQTVEEVRETLTKTEQTVEEFATGLQEVKEAVDSLREGGKKDRANEVLRNLAKSEFRGDIEYHVERFQADTREWVFDRVQNWLDDRNSQNRVMVISGNAGMGKSVIAAVVCKRMQEAGRLSGSHFCQHNNVRYRKPQLMLQSLACHPSHALPEYKQALVEELSRNLGTELNDMGVEELFSLLFKEPLSAVVDPGRNMLMVIDGLDESEYQGRNELLDVIANQFCKLPTWIRFLVTTRPATNITDKLTYLNPFELQSNDEKNLEDITTFFKKKLQHVIGLENVDALVEKLVFKSEGLMLYAHFLVLFINENPSVLNQGDLDSSLPLKISSMYSSYFKRLERDLMKETDVKEEEFLNLLCAITASREPLPVGFVSKILVPGTNSPLAKRKVLKALGSVSALLPIRDGCLHVIHKSVKDWLTDVSCYGEHEFIIDQNEGHRILASLCTCELSDLKQRGVRNDQFSATEKYALYHGARHVLHSDVEREPHELEELMKAFVMDLEIVYAKTCVNSTTAAEDLVWLQKQGKSTLLPERSQSILKTLLFLLRKYLSRFTNYPRMFLQTVLNQGGTMLSAEASDLLQNKYPEIPYMEYVRKETQQGGVVARFECSSLVACLDVSPQLDHMVCECDDGMLQLWSLHTGRLVWTRPVKVTKYCLPHHWGSAIRKLPSSSVTLFYRSVVFHPTELVVLPGILSHAYTIGGDLKPLFPGSNCSFSVCSISGDKTEILTNCPNNAKCLVMWSLKNGSEIARTTRDEDILSFARSQDGRLLAVSHSNGFICLLDVMDSFKTLAQTASPEVCGMLKFSPNNHCLFCLHESDVSLYHRLFRCDVNVGDQRTYSLHVSSNEVCYDHREFESFTDCGFLLGDLIPSGFCSIEFTFVLNKQSLLRWNRPTIEMLNTNEEISSSQGIAEEVALSLDGQTVYVVTYPSSVTAWNVSTGKLIAEKYSGNLSLVLIPTSNAVCPVMEGILIITSISTLELWNFDLSECVQRWTDFPRISEMIPISEERVACVHRGKVSVLGTTSGEIVSTILVSHWRIITCDSKCQLLTIDRSASLLLSDDTAVLWKNDSLQNAGNLDARGVFSPLEEFLVITNVFCVYILDAVSGITLRALHADAVELLGAISCKFVSDEECVVSCYGDSVQLFNVKSGDLLSVINNEGKMKCLAACPRKRLLAIGFKYSTPNFKVLHVCLPRDKDSRKIKRVNNAPETEEQNKKEQRINNRAGTKLTIEENQEKT